jgi:hypothetical protein
MLNILLLAATGGLVNFLIAVLIVGAIMYVVSLAPFIPQFAKQIVYVLGAVIIVILAIKLLVPLIGGL